MWDTRIPKYVTLDYALPKVSKILNGLGQGPREVKIAFTKSWVQVAFTKSHISCDHKVQTRLATVSTGVLLYQSEFDCNTVYIFVLAGRCVRDFKFSPKLQSYNLF